MNTLQRPFGLISESFTEMAPLGFEAGDANLYRYVGNNATNLTDPSGLHPSDDDVSADARVKITPGTLEQPFLRNNNSRDMYVGNEKVGKLFITTGAQVTRLARPPWKGTQSYDDAITFEYLNESSLDPKQFDFVQFGDARAKIVKRLGNKDDFGGFFAEEIEVGDFSIEGGGGVGTVKLSTSDHFFQFVDHPELGDPRMNSSRGLWKPTLKDGVRVGLTIADQPRLGQLIVKSLRDRGEDEDRTVETIEAELSFTTYLTYQHKPIFVVNWKQTSRWSRSTRETETFYNVISGSPISFDADKERLNKHVQMINNGNRFEGRRWLKNP